jgi:hypothetical protein
MNAQHAPDPAAARQACASGAVQTASRNAQSMNGGTTRHNSHTVAIVSSEFTQLEKRFARSQDRAETEFTR